MYLSKQLLALINVKIISKSLKSNILHRISPIYLILPSRNSTKQLSKQIHLKIATEQTAFQPHITINIALQWIALRPHDKQVL